MTISKDKKNRIWTEYVGNNALAMCYCCNQKVMTNEFFELGYLDNSNNSRNLRPICLTCSKITNNQSISMYRSQLWKPYLLLHPEFQSCYGKLLYEYITYYTYQGYDMMDVDYIHCNLHMKYCPCIL
jgi:hypothetical protein